MKRYNTNEDTSINKSANINLSIGSILLFSLTFTGFTAAATVICSALLTPVVYFYMLSKLGFETIIASIILIYLIYSFLFFKFRPKKCNVFVLPISFTLFVLRWKIWQTIGLITDSIVILLFSLDFYISSFFFIVTLTAALFLTFFIEKTPEPKQQEKHDDMLIGNNNDLQIKRADAILEAEKNSNENPYPFNGLADKIMKTDELQKKLKLLLGDTAYNQLLKIIEHDIPSSLYEPDDPNYSGFIGDLSIGVNLQITDDGYVYCLGCNLDNDSCYTLYTNDKRYTDTLPDFMKIYKPHYKLKFVYKEI